MLDESPHAPPLICSLLQVGQLPVVFLIFVQPVLEVDYKFELRNMLQSCHNIVDHLCNPQIAWVDAHPN